MMIRYGLIGSGMMGQEHIRNIALIDGIGIAAIADPDDSMRHRALALQGGTATVFADWRDLLAADLCDAYVIASPNDIHYVTLIGAMPHNKPILCEKPMCTTVADCRRIVALQDARTAPLWIAMEYRYMPPAQRLLAELDKGTIGVPVMMSVREHRFPFLPKVNAWNRFSRRTGGTLVEKCCHFWDLMRLMLKSDPVRVCASGGSDANHLDELYDGAAPDILDNAFVIVDFANGARGMLDLCMFAEGSRWQEIISLTGPEGQAGIRVPGPQRFAPDGRIPEAQFVLSDRATRAETVEEIAVDPALLAAGDHHGATFFQHRRFAELVRSGRGKAEVGAEDGLWSVLVGVAAERSARSGKAISIADL
ncbi:Gfo/Idh/MocA family protein [Tropicimonas sp.]|uniref:Gfo/Idh/MocA family protein n=1 Tax=Tropicimonas sp. TaxID=2067044 RepID=UPI003A861259